MAARFAVLADNHVRQSIVEALRRAGWDVVRSVDPFAYPIEYIKPQR